MEEKDVIRMAREAELTFGSYDGREVSQYQEGIDLTPYLVRFAHLVEIAVLADLVAREGGTA